MGLAILALLLGLSVYLFVTGKQVPSIMIFTFFITEGFQIVPANISSVSFFDFALAYVVIICIIMGIKDRGFFALNDTLSKLVVLLLAYLVFEFILTVVTEAESTDLASKVLRRYSFIGLFFVIRSIKPQRITAITNFLYALTTITLVIYLAQIALKEQILTGTVEGIDATLGDAESRYRNTPFLFEFCLFFTLFFPALKKYRIPLTILFLAGLIAPLNRGPIIAFVVVMVAYYVLEGKVGALFKYALIAVGVGFLAWPILARRFSKENTGSDVKSSLQLRSYKNFNTSGGGTFEFRLLLLEERFDYLVAHPEYLATGVGMRHEDSKNTFNKFHFYLGAIKATPSGGAEDKKVIQQIETSDMVWATPLLRFGFIGVGLYLLIFVYLLIFFFKRRKEPLATVGLLLVAMNLFNSLATDVLMRPYSFFLMFLLYAYALRAKTFTFNITKQVPPVVPNPAI
jgi:hypothetical protein